MERRLKGRARHYRDLYPHQFEHVGNRGIVFNVADKIPKQALRHCIALALTYHAAKRTAAR